MNEQHKHCPHCGHEGRQSHEVSASENRELNELHQNDGNRSGEKKRRDYFFPISIIAASVIFGVSVIYAVSNLNGLGVSKKKQAVKEVAAADVAPEAGVELPARWGDLGARMVKAGVIDQKKFEEVYASRGGLDPESKKLLTGTDNGNLKITPQNSGVILNLLWGLGLANKNPILDAGPMKDKRYGGAENFASTAGWTLSMGGPMVHYSYHPFMKLTQEQQDMVERVSKGIFRPCCGNSTYFPDCNHGMAMLGLLELMASQGVNESDMYKAALAVNEYWFPDMYATISQFMSERGMDWKSADPKAVLGANFSSGQGFQAVSQELSKIQAERSGIPQGGSSGNQGGSCGV